MRGGGGAVGGDVRLFINIIDGDAVQFRQIIFPQASRREDAFHMFGCSLIYIFPLMDMVASSSFNWDPP